jgi:hypothetical protein
LRRSLPARVEGLITRKRIALAAIVLGFIFLSTWYLSNRPPRINERIYAKIHAGMTKADVIELIGAPPGYYGMSKRPVFDGPPGQVLDPRIEDDGPNVQLQPFKTCRWQDANNEITVLFSANGMAVFKAYAKAEPVGWRDAVRNALESILRWFGM